MADGGNLGFNIAGRRRASYVASGASPADLGQEVVRFIRTLGPDGHNTMARHVAEITWVDRHGDAPRELDKLYSSLGYRADPRITTRDSAGHTWLRVLSGVVGSDMLYAIKDGNLEHLIASGPSEIHFRAWAYYIDFEKRELEVWRAHDMLDVVGFDTLMELGDEYMRRLQRMCDAELEDWGKVEFIFMGIEGPWKKHEGDTKNV